MNCVNCKIKECDKTLKRLCELVGGLSEIFNDNDEIRATMEGHIELRKTVKPQRLSRKDVILKSRELEDKIKQFKELNDKR